MDTPQLRRTLIVANLTASTPILIQEIEKRADEQPTKFTLLIPNVDSRRLKSADWTLQTATKLLAKAANGPVEGSIGGEDAFESVKQELAKGQYDDVIISTLPKARSEWLRKDLPTRVEGELNVPVTVITPPEEPSPIKAFTDQFSAKTPPTAG